MTTMLNDLLSMDPRDMTDEQFAALKGADPEGREALVAFVGTLAFDLGEWMVESDRHPEDGERKTVNTFYVRATAPNGKRWRHFFTFSGPTKYDGDYDTGFGLSPRNQEYKSETLALARAEKLLMRVYEAQMADTMVGLNPEYWMEDAPVYGSESWTKDAEFRWNMDDSERAAVRARGGGR